MSPEDDTQEISATCLLDHNVHNSTHISTEHSTPKRANLFAQQSTKKTKLSHDTDFGSRLLNLLQEPKELNIFQDADNLMFLSFAPRYKQLSEENKIDFQMHMLVFFKNLKTSESTFVG